MFLKLLLSMQLAFGALTNPPTSTERQFLGWKNMLSNPGFESGKAGWTVTTTAFTITTMSGEFAEGQRAAEWNPAGAESLRSPGWTPATNAGGNAVGFCRVRSNADADYDVEIYDGSAVVAEIDVPASTTFVLIPVNFVAVGGTTYKVQVTSAADDDEIQVDGCGIGYAEGYNISNVSQAELVGTATWTGVASCQWSTTSTSFANFAADTDCNNPTVTGKASAAGTKIPAVVLTNIPAGNYFFVGQGMFTATTTTSGGWRFSDGTNHGNSNAYDNKSSAVNVASMGTITGWIPYTTGQSSVTVNIQGYLASGTATYITATTATNTNLSIQVWRYPLASQQVYTPDTVAQSWSGYHTTTCSWTTTSASYVLPTGDATCSLTQRTNTNFGTVTTLSDGTGPQAGITVSLTRAGTYEVCANVVNHDSSSATREFQLWDGTTVIDTDTAAEGDVGIRDTNALCGLYNATSVGSKTFSVQAQTTAGTLTINGSAGATIEWSVKAITQSVPAPLLVNSVVSGYSGVTRVEWVDFGGATEGTNDCSATPCTIYRQSGGISSVSRAATGDYTVNFSTASTTPWRCNGMSIQTGVAVTVVTMGTTVPTTTAHQIRTYDLGTPTTRDSFVKLTCIGTK